jgi:hypothetical protein
MTAEHLGDPVQVAPIVEGHGDVRALPVLIRSLAQRLAPERGLVVHSPVRVPKSRLVAAGGLEPYVEYCARVMKRRGTVLIVIDGDDDCPAKLGPELLARATAAVRDVRTRVVIAQREFEAWGVASASTLGGWRGLPDPLDPPSDPEAIRDPKRWLESRFTPRQRYSETLDQPALASRIDLAARARADSLDKLCREIDELLRLG